MRIEAERRDLVDAAQVWWLLALLGVASLVAGVILVLKPSDSLATLAVVVGIFLLLDGIVELVGVRQPGEIGRSPRSRGSSASSWDHSDPHPTHAVAAIGLLIGSGSWPRARFACCARSAGWRQPLRGWSSRCLRDRRRRRDLTDPHIGYATLAVITGSG